MSKEPKIAALGPQVVVLGAGVHRWCHCGRSTKKATCDDSHPGSGFEPIEINLDEAKKLALCCCKRSARAPICDGSHVKLQPPDEDGAPVQLQPPADDEAPE